jgi:DNA polymerase-1
LIFWKWSFRWIFRRKPPYYKTLQDTEHSYQIIQGDLGLKLLLQTYQNKALFVLILKRTRCLACRVSRDFFSYEKGKDFTYPFRRIRLKQKHSLKIYAFFENEKSRKLDRIWNMIKNTVELRHKCRRKLFDTMIAHYLINPDMRHNMDILADLFKIFPKAYWRLNWKKGKIKSQCVMSN